MGVLYFQGNAEKERENNFGLFREREHTINAYIEVETPFYKQSILISHYNRRHYAIFTTKKFAIFDTITK